MRSIDAANDTKSSRVEYQEDDVKQQDAFTSARSNTNVIFNVSLLYNLIRHNEKRRPWWSRIEPFLLLGAMPLRENQHLHRLTRDEGVSAVVTMNQPFEMLPNLLATPITAREWQDAGVTHCVGATMDFAPPTLVTIAQCVAFVHDQVDNHERVTYVHCKAGRGRSTVVVVAFLMRHRGLSLDDALALVRTKRPWINMNRQQRHVLQAYAESLHP